MPEGDTVYRSAAELHAALKGRTLIRTDFRVPAFATSDLSGMKVREVFPIGKHILFRIEGGVSIHTHFKMEGRWDLYATGRSWRGPAYKVRAVLEVPGTVAVGTDLGLLELIPTKTEREVLGHLGPDLLAPETDPRAGWGASAPRINLWDRDEAVRRILAEPEVPIGDALIDQSKVAGLGNVYRSEICFLKGLDPQTPVAEAGDIAGILDLSRRIIWANRTTGAQITTGDRRRGRSRWVYGRRGEPCRRCGTPIQKASSGPPGMERVTYWCPHCQRDAGAATNTANEKNEGERA